MCEGKSALHDQIHWADGFILVYDISDRSSFLTAKAIVHLIRELQLGSGKRYGEGSMTYIFLTIS